MANSAKEQLLSIFQAALSAVEGRAVVKRYLSSRPFSGEVNLVAIGKAATSMAWGAWDVLGETISRSLVITKKGHSEEGFPFECFEAAHPVPDESSLEAGRRLLGFVTSAPANSRFLFLISGGSSSLVESLPSGVSLEDLRRLNEWLLASGMEIGVMNAVRKRFSRLKGGGLIPYLRKHPALSLMISDVANDDPAVIGSGLLVFGAREVSPDVLERLPPWLRDRIGSHVPSSVDISCVPSIENRVVANNGMAIEGAVEAAKRFGLEVFPHYEPYGGEVTWLAHQFVEEVRRGPPGLYVWGGESTIALPPHPGRGGRNQSLALEAARLLVGHDTILFLAAGTDGTDGPTQEAGGLVDGDTVSRGERRGMRVTEALRNADAGSFLALSGDLVRTGPTGTNVMDLVLALKRG